MIQACAILYASICAGVIIFQLFLIAGAPWGHLTQGGMHKGTLPTQGRVAAGVSIIVLALMGLSVLSAAALPPHWPIWTGWTTLALQVLSTLMNWMTPSRAERLLWGPVTTVMLIAAGIVLLF